MLLQVVSLDLAQRGDTAVFMVIAIVAVVILLISFVLGELFDFVGDFIEFGEGDGGLISVQSVAAFLAGFGATGWLLAGYFDVTPLLAALGGIAGGLPVAALVVMLTRYLRGQEVSTSFDIHDLIGEQAIVVLNIPEQGVGRVQVARAGGTHTLTARVRRGGPIAQGSVVRIDQIIAGDLIVVPAE